MGPGVYALGFIDCDHISARCMLTIFMMFAIRTEASVLRMLPGSPADLPPRPDPQGGLDDRGVKVHTKARVRDIEPTLDSQGRPS